MAVHHRFERWPMYTLLVAFFVGVSAIFIWKVPSFALPASGAMLIPVALFIIGDAFHDTSVGRAIGHVFGAVEDRLGGSGGGVGDAGSDGGGTGDC